MNSDSAREGANRDELGSLAQHARQKQLTTARGILFAIGILSVIANLFFFLSAESMVRNEVDKELAKGGGRQNIPNQRRQEIEKLEADAVRETQIASVIFACVGIVFVIFGFVIYQHPVPITGTALFLYIAAALVSLALDPESIAKGLIVKIFIVAALIKSIAAARAYEEEKAKDALADNGFGEAAKETV